LYLSTDLNTLCSGQKITIRILGQAPRPLLHNPGIVIASEAKQSQHISSQKTAQLSLQPIHLSSYDNKRKNISDDQRRSVAE
jgi:hypothetical protein